MGTLVVALIGLVLAILSLFWQIVSWLLGFVTRVKVKLAFGVVGGPQPFTAVVVTAINKSAHPIRVAGVYVYRQDGSGERYALVPRDWEKLPGVVQPRDAENGHFDYDKLREDGVDFTRPLVASVMLATEKEFRSSPVILRRLPSRPSQPASVG